MRTIADFPALENVASGWFWSASRSSLDTEERTLGLNFGGLDVERQYPTSELLARCVR